MTHTPPTSAASAASHEAVPAGLTTQPGSREPGRAAGPGAHGVAYRPLALAYRLVALALIVTGLARITSIFSGDPLWNSLLFYTVQSNVLCLAWMVVLTWATLRDILRAGPRGFSAPSPRTSGAVMMAITVTLLVYLVVLVPSSFVQGSNYVPFSLTDNLIHIITPCLLIIDWALFVPKGTFRAADPLRWALIPLAYLVFALIYGGSGGEFRPGQTYAYPFLDVATLGWGGVAAWVVGLSVALIGVGYLFLGIDKLAAGKRPAGA